MSGDPRHPLGWVGATREWLGRRHSLRAELLIVVVLYAAYDLSRGLALAGRRAAVRHARTLEHLERLVHLDIERSFQRLAGGVPGLLGVFGLTYMTLHLAATGGVLLWLHRRRPEGYAQLRTAVLLTSFVSLVGFVVWPTAPPRLAGIGIIDTIARSGIPLNSTSVSAFYNPYAAFPSLHEAYAVLTGYGLWRWGRRLATRVIGVVYPVWVAAEVIATGNHFLVDVVAGVGVAALGVAGARWILLGRRAPAVTAAGGAEVSADSEAIGSAQPGEEIVLGQRSA